MILESSFIQLPSSTLLQVATRERAREREKERERERRIGTERNRACGYAFTINIITMVLLLSSFNFPINFTV